jgi:hypothetical protein
MFSSHDRRSNGRDYDIDEVLVRTDDRRGRVIILFTTIMALLVRRGIVEQSRGCRKCAESDRDTRGLEVSRIERNNTNHIVVVWLEVFDRDRGFLWGDIAD